MSVTSLLKLKPNCTKNVYGANTLAYRQIHPRLKLDFFLQDDDPLGANHIPKCREEEEETEGKGPTNTGMIPTFTTFTRLGWPRQREARPNETRQYWARGD